MENFTITHNVCGKVATLAYFTEEDWYYDGENEVPYDMTRVYLDCEHCKEHVEIAPERY